MRLVVAALSLASVVCASGVALAQDPYAQQPPPYGEQPPQQYQQPAPQPYQGQPAPDPYAQQPPQQQYAQPSPYDQPPAEVESTAPQYGYVGPHPEPYDVGNGACYQTGVHFHAYPPFDQYLFRQSNGYFYFVGDLGDFGYNQQLWGYQGNHPFPVEYGGGYCYIGWPHRHHFAPPVSMQFRFAGGYYSYFGPWDAGYYANRVAWNGYYNGYYRNSYYGGRYWTVRPAHVYRPSYGWGAPGVYRPGMVVRSPSGVTVTVGGHYGGYARPGVVVGAPHPGYAPGHPGYAAPAHPGYVAPPVAHPGYVAPPAAHPGYATPSHTGYVAPPAAHPVAAPAPAPARRPAAPPTPSAPQRRHY